MKYIKLDADDIMEEVDQKMDYNGDHSWLRRNPDFYIK